MAQSIDRAVSLEADTDVRESLDIPLANLVKEKVLARNDDRGQKSVTDLKGGKRYRSRSLSTSSESAAQPLREDQPVQINATVGNDFRGLNWQDDDEAQKILALDTEANVLIRRTVRPNAKAK